MTFIAWLYLELDNRDWSQADLARRSGLTPSAISLVISGDRNPGPTFCNAVAVALYIPPPVVFQAAGLLPPDTDPRRVEEQIAAYKLAGLDDDQLTEVNKFIDFIKSRDKSTIVFETGGIIPPEIVKD